MAEEEGTTIKTLEEEPKIGAHLLWVWQAFTDLNYRRGVGFNGPVPITFTDIEAYCRLKAIYSRGERERLLRLLDPLDRTWMAIHREQAEAASRKGSPPPPEAAPPRPRSLRRKPEQVS